MNADGMDGMGCDMIQRYGGTSSTYSMYRIGVRDGSGDKKTDRTGYGRQRTFDMWPERWTVSPATCSQGKGGRARDGRTALPSALGPAAGSPPWGGLRAAVSVSVSALQRAMMRDS